MVSSRHTIQHKKPEKKPDNKIDQQLKSSYVLVLSELDFPSSLASLRLFFGLNFISIKYYRDGILITKMKSKLKTV